ncbi:MAG TPA: AlpA family phage regulatory protein [Terriglobia bacterium]|nr:AlpA family phage regulatory protein [Terriglobia bacterium]
MDAIQKTSSLEILEARGRLLRLPEVRRETGLGRSTIYRLMKTRRFPSAVSLGGAVAWWESEIEDWKRSRPRLVSAEDR